MPRQELSAAVVEAVVQRPDNSAIFLPVDEQSPILRLERGEKRGRGVGRSVVDDMDLDIRERLVEDALDRVGYVARAVKDRHQHVNRSHRQPPARQRQQWPQWGSRRKHDDDHRRRSCAISRDERRGSGLFGPDRSAAAQQGANRTKPHQEQHPGGRFRCGGYRNAGSSARERRLTRARDGWQIGERLGPCSLGTRHLELRTGQLEMAPVGATGKLRGKADIGAPSATAGAINGLRLSTSHRTGRALRSNSGSVLRCTGV